MRQINYIASLTAAKFHQSPKIVRGFMGPVGNGKSVCCVNELHRLAVLQEPNDHSIRKTRWIIVRNTSLELRTTTVKTFQQWIPEEVCPLVFHPMISGTMKYNLGDGTSIEAEFLFLAMDKPDDVKKVLSLEITGGFINEAREIPYAVVKAVRERIGRYPSAIDGYEDNPERNYKAPRGETGDYQPCTRKCLIMDTNGMDDMHWWYQLAEEGTLRTDRSEQAKVRVAVIFDFFRGVAPLIKNGNEYEPNPLAENVSHLPGGYDYYLDMLAGNTEDHINVMVMGNYGTIKSGKPVYPQYNDGIHCPGNIQTITNLPIGIGWDFGLTPACIFGQLTEMGQMRVIAELQAEDMNVRQFARDVVKPFIQRNFYGIKIAFSFGDPSGNNRGEGEGKSSIKILNDDDLVERDGEYTNQFGDIIEPLKMGFTTEPAPTNEPVKRIDAVESFMIRLVGGGLPGYQLSKRCRMLRKGKLGGYHYRQMKVSGEERYKDTPEKNMYSHTADAEQYLALGFVGGYVVELGNGYDEFEDYNDTGPGGY